MTHPVLFLDIDGVLNSKEFFYRLQAEGKPARLHYMDREKVEILNGIVAATNCRIVVSSTWRRDTKCRRILRYYGFQGTFCRDWRTDWLRSFDEPDLVRGDEIEDWLRRNGRPPYAIVDDDADMLTEQMPRFVQTSFEDGLITDHAGRLVKLLSDRGGLGR